MSTEQKETIDESSSKLLHQQQPQQNEKTDLSQEHDTKSNFGAKGWTLILFTGFMLFLTNGLSTDGINIAVPALAELHGWNTGSILGLTAISNLVAIVGILIFGWVCTKKGPQFTATLALLVGGAAYIWYGFSNSIAQYLIALCLIMAFTNVFGWVSGGAYLANWFPKKKGLALGWATMGNNLSSAIYVPILTFLMGKVGIQFSIAIIGVLVMATAILPRFFTNTPEESGFTPDNIDMSPEDVRANKKIYDAYVSPWTIKKIFTNKEFWLISLGLGLMNIVTVGVMSQLVPRMVSLGFSQRTAILSMSVCAIVGIAGSYGWGFIDQKTNAKKAASLFSLWYAAAILLNLSHNKICIYLSIVMIGIAIGGLANFPISLTTSVYGRFDFSRLYTFINPLIAVVRSFSFVFLAISLKHFGSYTAAYWSFVVLSVIAAFLLSIVNINKYNTET
ncbi:MAG: MFS transporter [Spirochaetales bacterium]|nr:MFS transporter [Spirochaetales bacterium]